LTKEGKTVTILGKEKYNYPEIAKTLQRESGQKVNYFYLNKTDFAKSLEHIDQKTGLTLDNIKSLQDAAARRDIIILQIPADYADGALKAEIDYMQSEFQYTLSLDKMELIPPEIK
jgi:hypothetical protein